MKDIAGKEIELNDAIITISSDGELVMGSIVDLDSNFAEVIYELDTPNGIMLEKRVRSRHDLFVWRKANETIIP